MIFLLYYFPFCFWFYCFLCFGSGHTFRFACFSLLFCTVAFALFCWRQRMVDLWATKIQTAKSLAYISTSQVWRVSLHSRADGFAVVWVGFQYANTYLIWRLAYLKCTVICIYVYMCVCGCLFVVALAVAVVLLILVHLLLPLSGLIGRFFCSAFVFFCSSCVLLRKLLAICLRHDKGHRHCQRCW